MKDVRTHLAHKAEHAVDLAVTLQGADRDGTTTIVETAIAAAEQIEDAQAMVQAPTRWDAPHAFAWPTNILKRLLIHAGGFNLGLIMRHLIGSGTPRGLLERPAPVMATLLVLLGATRRWLVAISACS